jgi:hypothetical protein
MISAGQQTCAGNLMSRSQVGRLFCFARPTPRMACQRGTRRSDTEERSVSHKYQLQQLIRLTHAVSDGRAKSTSIYEVTRLMPADERGEFSYRVKSSGFGERAVREFEIAGPASRA